MFAILLAAQGAVLPPSTTSAPVRAWRTEIVGTEAETAWLNNASYSHRLFGTPPTSLATMLTWTAAWRRQGGETWGKPTGFERRDGRF